MISKSVALLAASAGLAALGTMWMPSFVALGGANHIYDTAPVTRGAIRKVVSTSGPVRALVTVSIGSQLSGQISELKVDFNSEVKANDELAIIDDKTFVAKVAQAKADLEAAKAAVGNQAAALTKMKAIERNALLLLERQRSLAAKGIVATTTLDNATRDAEVATADVQVVSSQLENAKANVAQRESQLLQAQIDLDRTRIRSPIDGTVIARTVDVGQTVAASLQAPELFKIAQDLRRIRIEAQVNEADVGLVSAGNLAEFTVDAYPDRQFKGKVAQVRLAATELNNIVTYTAIIEAANDDRKLFPGMTANVRVQSTKVDAAMRVPTDALRFKPRPGAVPLTPRNQATQRLSKELNRLEAALALTPEQIDQIAEAMKGVGREHHAPLIVGSASAGDLVKSPPGGNGEDQFMQRLKAAVAAAVTPAQAPAIDDWKIQREIGGRSSQRDVVVWVVTASGEAEARRARLGLVDESFAEVTGGDLKEGDSVILRSREAGKK